jgi:hypothetical protein
MANTCRNDGVMNISHGGGITKPTKHRQCHWTPSCVHEPTKKLVQNFLSFVEQLIIIKYCLLFIVRTKNGQKIKISNIFCRSFRFNLLFGVYPIVTLSLIVESQPRLTPINNNQFF